jgi:hypothetical protein
MCDDIKAFNKFVKQVIKESILIAKKCNDQEAVSTLNLSKHIFDTIKSLNRENPSLYFNVYFTPYKADIFMENMSVFKNVASQFPFVGSTLDNLIQVMDEYSRKTVWNNLKIMFALNDAIVHGKK